MIAGDSGRLGGAWMRQSTAGVVPIVTPPSRAGIVAARRSSMASMRRVDAPRSRARLFIAAGALTAASLQRGTRADAEENAQKACLPPGADEECPPDAMLADERRHASLAWAALSWALRQHPRSALAIDAALERATAQLSAGEFVHPGGLEHFGLLGPSQVECYRAEAVQALIEPRRAALLRR
jgi:hypothetical protein